MQKWEYRMAHVGDAFETLQDLLNRLGRDGWELVSAPHAGAAGAVVALILKRPAAETETAPPVPRTLARKRFG